MEEGAPSSPCLDCEQGTASSDAEIEHLRRHLQEGEDARAGLAARLDSCSARCTRLRQQGDIWREKYERLYESYSRVQKLNQTLEERLLQLAEKARGDKAQLSADVATLSLRLANTKHGMQQLHKENERYKNDMNLAIQLLQCKPDNFVSHKLDNLPLDTQNRVSQFVMAKTKTSSPNLPSKNGNEETIDASEYEFNVSASLMSKILEDSMQDTVTKHCDTCTCNKSKGNLFSRDENNYSVGTQTVMNGEMKNSLCLNCNGDVKSIRSNISNRSGSPQVHRLLHEERNMSPKILPPNLDLLPPVQPMPLQEKIVKENDIVNDRIKLEEKKKLAASVQREIVKKIGDELNQIQNNFAIEPATHHRLCDRTKTSAASNVSDINLFNDEPQPKTDVVDKESKKEIDERKNSICSVEMISQTSSIAKSTTSTHRSNTHVGPGPRFCSLRVQAGSKNILLDNAQPDVPPVLYTRQSRCADLLRDDEIVLDSDKKDDNANLEVTHVIESTLVDVHVDSTEKDESTEVNNVNPVLMNVSASPLQPLRTHTFTNPPSVASNKLASVTQVENNFDMIESFTDKPNIKCNGISDKPPTTAQGVKIFNFDLYEQNMLSNQFSRPLRKIDMSQIAHIENTKISKDLPPLGNEVDLPKAVKQPINVYPNVTQTQIKVTDSKKATVGEQSTSSLSSDDSAALLQKQQLIRVAEWVQQNLEQQNKIASEPSEPYPPKLRRDSKNNLKDIVHKMPHPVTKYSNYEEIGKVDNACIAGVASPNVQILSNIVVKETVFPVECDAAPQTSDDSSSKHVHEDVRTRMDSKISAEELARMEYNVKKFLLSGSPWSTAPPVPGRSRRTSHKTETDL